MKIMQVALPVARASKHPLFPLSDLAVAVLSSPLGATHILNLSEQGKLAAGLGLIEAFDRDSRGVRGGMFHTPVHPRFASKTLFWT
jgi:hypothetical protein